MSSMFSLDGRVALVTGAGQGVGAAISRALARQGARVAVNDLFEDRARSVVAEIEQQGGVAQVAMGDVTCQADVEQLVQPVLRSWGGVDVLVNNAGIPADGMLLERFADSDPEDWPTMIDLNLYGVLRVTHALISGMIEREYGRVVCIVSDAGRVGERNQAVYAAAKAGAAGFSRALAKEVGAYGITCNCLALGSIASPERPPDAQRLAKQLKHYPTGRLGQPADVASTVVWLASGEASWVTGQTIPVNGGYSTS